MHLDFTGTRLFHLNDGSQENTFKSEYRLIDFGKYSRNACEHATHIVNEWYVGTDQLKEQSLCVSTSEGNWAIMKLVKTEGTSIFSITGVKFDVFLF